MQFRPATNRDADQVRDLVFSILEEYGLKADPAGTDLDLADIEGQYAARGGCFELLVDETGHLAGCYGLHPLADGVCELRKMYLRRDHRGRGLGKTILRRAIDRARSLGVRNIHLETATVLNEAVSLYKSFGFQPFQPAHLSSRCDLAMRLELPSVEAG